MFQQKNPSRGVSARKMGFPSPFSPNPQPSRMISSTFPSVVKLDAGNQGGGIHFRGAEDAHGVQHGGRNVAETSVPGRYGVVPAGINDQEGDRIGGVRPRPVYR